ncbi:hypothetical protein [Haloplanus halophilus]|uniref:hypothetical protein n=1 Tax=Haloplanus halophilus TaxID=2949993 RepID=UPI0020426A6E|nr:hypothetical protein [Haloplanus sp. GDY1]
MAQLRSCYFCGAVGDSLREYEVVPERLDSAAGGRSAVLCSTCHEKLRRVIEPLARAADSDAGTDDADPGPPSHQEVTFESEVGSADNDAPSSAEGTAEGTADEASADDGADEASTPEGDAAAAHEAEDESASADDSTATADDVPEEYYKVLRLLQNREFPMERAELTGLVTGAYDVSEPQCERILETAVERGVLVEQGSTLDLGRN